MIIHYSLIIHSCLVLFGSLHVSSEWGLRCLMQPYGRFFWSLPQCWRRWHPVWPLCMQYLNHQSLVIIMNLWGFLSILRPRWFASRNTRWLAPPTLISSCPRCLLLWLFLLQLACFVLCYLNDVYLFIDSLFFRFYIIHLSFQFQVENRLA